MKYYLRVVPFYDSYHVYITTKKSISKASKLKDPNYYYGNPHRCNADGVIGACALDTNEIEDVTHPKFHHRICYYPSATYVHLSYRRKGFGKLLYHACLAVIKGLEGGKKGIRFVQHKVGQPGVGDTSKKAKRIYKSLTDQGYLTKIAPSVFEIKKYPKVTCRVAKPAE